MNRDRLLTTATLIHLVVRDLLNQNDFDLEHFPELVDLAVVVTGLGLLQSNIGLVNSSGTFWDSTLWMEAPKPFLDTQALAYAHAVAAWCRNETQPDWIEDLPTGTKKPLRMSLKFLCKTKDTFFQPANSNRGLLGQSQDAWRKLAEDDSAESSQLIALRHLQFTEPDRAGHEKLLAEKMQSNQRAVLLQAIAATDRMQDCSEAVSDELHQLIRHTDDEVRAKAIWSLTRLKRMDDDAVEVAARMVEDRAKFVTFAGLFALSSLDSVPDHVLPPINRGFVRSLQVCDYEFVGLYVTAFDRWMDDPQVHFDHLLREDSPEYLEIANEALQNVRENLVA